MSLFTESCAEETEIRNLIATQLDEHYNPISVSASACGFGSQSDIEITGPYQGFESGLPDLVFKRKYCTDVNHPSRTYIECTGSRKQYATETREYWVYVKKIEYLKRHPEQDIFIVVRYHHPSLKTVIIKPDPFKDYPIVEKTIFGKRERIVVFTDDMPEIWGYEIEPLVEYIYNKSQNYYHDKFPVVQA